MAKADMSGLKLAKKSGVSVTQISNIKLGHSGSTYDTAVKLANALSVPVTDLIESEA